MKYGNRVFDDSLFIFFFSRVFFNERKDKSIELMYFSLDINILH